MRKIILVAPLLILLQLIITPASAQRSASEFSYQRDTAMLYFRPGSAVLYEQYKSNESELSSIMRFVAQNAAALQSGRAHLNVVAYITEQMVGNIPALNAASIQASVVRAQFKTRYNIPHSAITFSIDTTRNTTNCVRVDYIALPVPEYSNSAIYYSESSSYSAQASQMARYTPTVPYTNYHMYLCRLDPNYGIGTLALVPTQSQIVESIEQDQENIDSLSEALASLGTPEGPALATPPSANQDLSNRPQTTPMIAVLPQPTETTKVRSEKASRDLASSTYEVFGLKTNLLYWAMAAPNLNLEFYFGQRVSIGVDGAYTWAWFLPADKAYHFWQVSGEVKVWLKGDKQFNGHFFGIHGGAGQYDVKFSELGRQGDFYSIGLTYGYLLPIGKHFNMEFEIGLGYTNYSLNKYQFVSDSYNVSVEKLENKAFFGPSKAAISLVWKF